MLHNATAESFFPQFSFNSIKNFVFVILFRLLTSHLTIKILQTVNYLSKPDCSVATNGLLNKLILAI